MASIPTTADGPVIYICKDAAGAVLYIGQTVRWAQRILTHRTTDWWPGVSDVELIPVADRGDRLDLERELIEHHQPPNNVVYGEGWREKVLMRGLDRSDSPAPRYVQIADTLRADIASGALAPGARLPGFRALGDAFGVSFATVGDAVKLLADEGAVVVGHGRVTRVTDSLPAEPPLAGTLAALAADVSQIKARLAVVEQRLSTE